MDILKIGHYRCNTRVFMDQKPNYYSHDLIPATPPISSSPSSPQQQKTAHSLLISLSAAITPHYSSRVGQGRRSAEAAGCLLECMVAVVSLSPRQRINDAAHCMPAEVNGSYRLIT
jgi:hypothetical protein